MATKKQLIERIAGDGYEPRAGDLVQRDGVRKRLLVVAVGKPSSGYYSEDQIILFKRTAGGWEFFEQHPFHNHPLTFVGIFEDFIFAGFGPTGQPHVMFKRVAGVLYVAGCRRFITLAKAAGHWRDKGVNSRTGWQAKIALARNAFAEARRRGWLKVSRARPVKKPRKAVRR